MPLTALTVVLLGAAAQQQPPEPKKEPVHSRFVLNTKYFQHEIVVTINGKDYYQSGKFGGGVSSQPLPFQEGKNTILVKFTVRAGKDPAKSGGSFCRLLLSPTMAVGEEALGLDECKATTPSAESVIELEMSKGRLVRSKGVQRHWHDAERKKPSMEVIVEHEPAAKNPDRDFTKIWDEKGHLDSEVQRVGAGTMTARDYKPDGSVGAEVKEGDGWRRGFHENGAVALETPYKNGLEEGQERSFFESGKLESTKTYKADKADGRYKSYDEKGVLRVEGNYKDDLKDGTWIRKDEAGKEVARSEFEAGKRTRGEDDFED